jgi:hypothetical protein
VRYLVRASVIAGVLVMGLTAGGRAATPDTDADRDPASAAQPGEVDRLLAAENEGRTVVLAPTIDELAFLRRVTVDMVGRIPTEQEIRDYLKTPAAERRSQAVERLLADPRLADRWTVFFSDMLRIRSYTDGGAQLTAFVHKAIEEGMPYDVMCKQLIAANGKAGSVPEVGFILGDNADPMALAGVTSQVFLGIRISCAQCHNHPFDVWTREQFYGLAAYFGKTQRIESQLTRAVYTTETEQTTILWPPEDQADVKDRKPMPPAFPFAMDDPDKPAEYIVRLVRLRTAQQQASTADAGPTVDDLLAEAGERAEATAEGALPDAFDVEGEARREGKNLRVQDDLYRASELRRELAEYVTSPRNRYFSRAFVNRVWAELVGRGFVEPIDDFSETNSPSHPRTLDYLAEEFVAQGFDLRAVLRLVTNSQAYQRGRLTDVDEATRQEAESAFASSPLRRMPSEALFDSIVQAGHLFEVKYPEGANMKTVRNLVRIELDDPAGGLAQIGKADDGGRMKGMQGQMVAQAGGYDLESAIEVDFDAVLAAANEAPQVEEMSIVSNEELEAMQMTDAAMRARYVERWVETQVDDNPLFASAMRMASPADPSHFLRVFGQPSRESLGEHRDDSASMRQALMMLNGRLTHEASRVGEFEPIYQYVEGAKADLKKAIRLAYREALTREPSADEVTEAQEIIAQAQTPREGMADLRWVLFNCHEFRFLP